MISDSEIQQLSELLLYIYGAEAIAEVTRLIDLMITSSDDDGRRFWEQIKEAIIRISGGDTPRP